MNPNAAEMAAAVEAGARVLHGLPVAVRMADGGEALLNIAAAAAGRPNPWIVTRRIQGGLVHQSTGHDSLWSYDGFTFPEETWGLLLAALREMPHESARHDPNADAARARAGRIVMKMADNMSRARALDALDAWEAILGALVDDGGDKDGRLYESADPSLRTRLLRVVCPSTGRAYVLCVPLTMKTARDARRGTLGLSPGDPDPDIET